MVLSKKLFEETSPRNCLKRQAETHSITTTSILPGTWQLQCVSCPGHAGSNCIQGLSIPQNHGLQCQQACFSLAVFLHTLFTSSKALLLVQVSIVSQEPVLFAESIMHNIAFGMPGGSGSVSLAMVRPVHIPSAAHAILSCSHVASLPDYHVVLPNCNSKIMGWSMQFWLPALVCGALHSFW